MTGYAKATNALLECRGDVREEILELTVVKLALLQSHSWRCN